MRIEIPLFPGFDELDAVGPFEVLRSAGRDVHLVGAHGPAEVVASHGARFSVADGLGGPDAFLVPGGGWNDRAPQGAWAEAQAGDLPRRLAEVAPGCTWIASVCTGAMLLVAAGLVGARPATTHRAALDDLRAGGAMVVDARVVDDGDLVTAAGVTSGLDLALWLVEREDGAQAADAVARELEYERRGRVWRRADAAAAAGRG